MAISDIRSTHKTITATEALVLAHQQGKKVTLATLISWCDSHVPKLSHRPGGAGGRLYIFEAAFVAFITGQEDLCKQLLTEMAQPIVQKED